MLDTVNPKVGRPLVSALLFLSLLPAVATAATFELELTGMLAFAPTADGGYDVLLVNELDQPIRFGRPGDPEAEITHVPSLELDCRDLVRDTAAAGDCESWPLAPDGVRRVIPLHQGFQVQLTVGGGNQTGKTVQDAAFDSLIVPLRELSPGEPSRFTLRPEAGDLATIRQHVIVRSRLNGGQISATAHPMGTWKFQDEGNVVYPADPGDGAMVAHSITWSIPFDARKGVNVALLPFDPISVGSRVLTFQDKQGDGVLTLTLSNEPDLSEFCAYAPQAGMPFYPFAGFYDLTAFAVDKDVVALKELPMPYPYGDAAKQCLPNTGIDPATGRRVTCTAVRFPYPSDR